MENNDTAGVVKSLSIDTLVKLTLDPKKAATEQEKKLASQIKEIAKNGGIVEIPKEF